MAITVNDKDLGMVTAYAYALAGGYTGTEAEFEALLGNIAKDLAEIENLSVQVQTLPAGSDATASYAEGVLTLGIPRGDKGETGDQGEIGPTPQLSVGTVTTGEPGTDAEVEITGTPEAPVLNFTIPRGDTGNITQAVRYDAAQTLTDAEKEQARANIDAANAGDVADLESVLDDAMSTNMISVPYEVSDEGKGIRFSNGALYTLSILNATDFIDISAYDYLTYTRIKATASSPVYGMAFYDVNKEYVSGIRATINNASIGYTLRDLQIPDGAVYARFSILADAETYGSFSLYGKSKLQKTVDDTIQNCGILAFNELVSVPYHIMFYGGFVKFADGTTTSSSNVYAYTDYVDVSRYSRIKYKSIADTISAPTHGMAFYDADKNFISGRRSVANSESLQYTEVSADVPKAAKYARFTVFIDLDTYGDFALWGTSKLYDLADVESPYEKNVLIAQVSPEWYEAQGESYEGFTINTLYSEIIAAWDGLLANSKGYITKDEIGTASDGQAMYCYKLIPARYRHNVGVSITNNAPVFLIVPSIHGYEKSAAYGTYYFARDLVYNFNKNPVLNSLRTKCIIYVVPVGNPWGFDNKQRKNANGVDCNRNWGPDPSGTDDPTSPYYPGAEPFDQPEVQAIKSVIDNAENLFFVVDYHTDGQYKAASWSEVNWITWGASVIDEAYSSRAYLASQFQLSDVSENLPLEYDFDTNGDAIGSITLGAANAPRPTISYYARTDMNILGGTFEGNNGLPIASDTAYSPMEQKINSELIGNWIKNLMLIYKNIDK